MSLTWTPPTLKTDRLILRSLRDSDIDGIFEYASDPEVTRFLNFETHTTPEDSMKFLQAYAFKHYAKEVPDPFGICLKENPQKVIGTVGCRWISEKNKKMEMGYVLNKSFWRSGYATEATKVMLEFCFTNYPVYKIQAYCTVENIHSSKVLEKIGMKKESHLRLSVLRRGQFWDQYLYSILKDDWHNLNSLT